MTLDITDTELDYIYRILYTTRPMSEVEGMVMKIRQQVASQQQIRPQLVKQPDEPLEALP